MPDRTQLPRRSTSIDSIRLHVDVFCLDFFSFCNDKIDPVVLSTNHSNGSFQIERFSRIQYVSNNQPAMFHDKQKKSSGSAMVPKARPFDEFFVNTPAMISSNNSFDGENNDLLIKSNKDWRRFKLAFSFVLSSCLWCFWLKIKSTLDHSIKESSVSRTSITRPAKHARTGHSVSLASIEIHLISNKKTADARKVCLCQNALDESKGRRISE